jgi:hypothetical protein
VGRQTIRSAFGVGAQLVIPEPELLANARLNVVEAQEEIRQLHERIATLEAARDVRSRMVRRDNLCYVSDGGMETGRYCPRCFEATESLMPLTDLPPGVRDFGRFPMPGAELVLLGARRGAVPTVVPARPVYRRRQVARPPAKS